MIFKLYTRTDVIFFLFLFHSWPSANKNRMHSRFQNNTRYTIFNLCSVWSVIIVSVCTRKWECDLIPWRRQTSEGTPHLRIWPSASTIWYYIDGLCTDPVSFFINGCCLLEWYRMIVYALISWKNSSQASLKNRFLAKPYFDVTLGDSHQWIAYWLT